MKKKSAKKEITVTPAMDAAEKPSKAKDMCQDCMCGSCECDHGGWGLLLLRLMLGITFVLHGVQKFTALAGTQGWFGTIPGLAPWMGTVIALVETVGGLALLLGIWTRWAAYLLATTMLGATMFTHFQWGAWAWILVIGAFVAMLCKDCMNSKHVWGWMLGIIIAIVIGAALYMMVGSGLKPDVNVERELLAMAALLAVAWNGPGHLSVHKNCDCCSHE
jgi:uncharacterized membrane protein YphA (DoxX/SURF4 family)